MGKRHFPNLKNFPLHGYETVLPSKKELQKLLEEPLFGTQQYYFLILTFLLRMNFLKAADIERIKSHKREVIMDHFELVSEYKPTGDQPKAIEKLVKGFKEGNQCETLLGVTGSGKTFTMANIIQQLNKPTLILAHNKTLAAQLYGEFKEFFPNNAVEYFVS